MMSTLNTEKKKVQKMYEKIKENEKKLKFILDQSK